MSQISWQTFLWDVKEGRRGPGPNYWNPGNVTVNGEVLTLNITRGADGNWYCSEITCKSPMSFGSYTLRVKSPVNALDKNIVLGMFNYGNIDGYDEIDIEISKWGVDNGRNGTMTVYPPSGMVRKSTGRRFDMNYGGVTEYVINWQRKYVEFDIYQIREDESRIWIDSWIYQPPDHANRIPTLALPFHINFWLYNGQAPSSGQPASVTLDRFVHEPHDDMLDLLPLGSIVLWSGTLANLPAGWALCDGQQGRQDLRGRFVVGYDVSNPAYDAIGKTGGLDSVILNQSQIPKHLHSGTTNTDGSHYHDIPIDWGGGGSGCPPANDYQLWSSDSSKFGEIQGATPNAHPTTCLGAAHAHQFTTDTVGMSQAHENRPPYFVLAYIQRVTGL